jgi:hypothetical protein
MPCVHLAQYLCLQVLHDRFTSNGLLQGCRLQQVSQAWHWQQVSQAWHWPKGDHLEGALEQANQRTAERYLACQLVQQRTGTRIGRSCGALCVN